MVAESMRMLAVGGTWWPATSTSLRAERPKKRAMACRRLTSSTKLQSGFYFGERGAPQVGAGSQAGAEVAAEVLLSGRLLLVGVSGEVVEEEAERARRGVIVAAATR